MGSFILPSLLKNRLLSLPIIYVGFGFLVFSLPLDLPLVNPEDKAFDRATLEYITEFIVIISLAGTGLKLDRKPGWKNWASGIRLLAITMPVTIAIISLLGYYWLGLSLASAVLLGGVLAPTDPVLAANVQVGPPNEQLPEDEVRFGLTLEAGLNDGLAFPFIYLAVALVSYNSLSDTLFTWAWWDFGYRILVGLAAGVAIGHALSWTFYRVRDHMQKQQDTQLQEGFFVLAATLLTYGITEILEGYGFLAVFIAAVVSRHKSKDDQGPKKSFRAIEQVEQAFLGIFLIAFGAILAKGGLSDLTFAGAAIGVLLILVVRPLAGLIGFLGCDLPLVEWFAISFFGIRGVGSLYYLAYAHNTEQFSHIDSIWATVNFTILVSIAVHGVTVNPILRWVDRKMGRPIK
nr:cation:proton antiporter [Lewinella sp. W8]